VRRLKLFRLFKKKEIEPPRLWAVVDYSEKAIEWCVGGEHNLRIFIYSKRTLVDELLYSPRMVELLRKQGIPVVFKAKYEIPLECLEEPKRFVSFGVIRW